MPTHLLRLLAAATLPLAIALTAPAVADAGVYHVYSCKTPGGRIVPVDGWSLLQEGGAFSAPADGCAMGNGLGAALNGDFPQASGARLGWRYTVPAGLELTGFRLWRFFSTTSAAEQNATPYAYVSWPTQNYTPDARSQCVAGQGCSAQGTAGSPLSADDVVEFTGLDGNVRDVYVMAGCGGSAGCVDRNSSVPMAQAVVKAFEASLRDTTAPVASDVVGPLVANPIHTGTENLSFNATDTGAGVYRAVVELHRETTSTWEPISTQIVDDNGGDCMDINRESADPYEFSRRVPCKTQVGGSLTLDTTMIPNGAHELRIGLEDASGNRSTLLGPTTFKVSNAGSGGSSGPGTLGAPTNGAGASNEVRIVLDRRTRRVRRLRFGQRLRVVATIRNELGKPVPGAQVDVFQRAKLPKARYRIARRPLVSGRNGKVRWTVPAGTSRRLRLAYKANLLNTTYQATTDLPLAVTAATTLRRNHRSYRNGQTIRFSGKVRSKPIPKGGVLVDLQAYKRGTGWVTFATKRSRAKGRWTIKYKLVSTTQTVRYKFRARVRQDSGYPYSAGKTKAMSVLVRP